MSVKTEHQPSLCNGGCGKLVRSRSVKAAELPGTVLNCGGGYCSACKKIYLPENLKVKVELDNCVNCKRPMRPWDQPISKYPGTLRKSSFGFCDPCYRSEVKLRKELEGSLPVDDEESITPSFDEKQAKLDLEAWLEERRVRIQTRRYYPIGTVVVQYNPHKEVGVILRDGNPVGATFGLKNSFELAYRLDTEPDNDMPLDLITI